MSATFDNDDFEIIPESEIVKGSRGRKPSPEAVRISAILLKVKKGQAVRLSSLAVDLNAKDVAVIKAKVGAQIRSGAAMANLGVSISWHPTSGVPQVKVV